MSSQEISTEIMEYRTPLRFLADSCADDAHGSYPRNQRKTPRGPRGPRPALSHAPSYLHSVSVPESLFSCGDFEEPNTPLALQRNGAYSMIWDMRAPSPLSLPALSPASSSQQYSPLSQTPSPQALYSSARIVWPESSDPSPWAFLPAADPDVNVLLDSAAPSKASCVTLPPPVHPQPQYDLQPEMYTQNAAQVYPSAAPPPSTWKPLPMPPTRAPSWAPSAHVPSDAWRLADGSIAVNIVPFPPLMQPQPQRLEQPVRMDKWEARMDESQDTRILDAHSPRLDARFYGGFDEQVALGLLQAAPPSIRPAESRRRSKRSSCAFCRIRGFMKSVREKIRLMMH